MAHPDHDQAVGRLVGARLRGAADRAVSGTAAEVHPDAETWAAYVDGGLQADEVVRLDTHLAGCQTCRRLLAVLAPEVSSGAAPASREAEAPAGGRGVVIPFPRPQVFAWMAAAAGLLMAVTLWSVSRLGGDPPAASVAMSTPSAPAEAPPAVSPVPSPADSAKRMSVPRSRLEDRKTVAEPVGGATAVEVGTAARQEQDAPKPDARADALARRSTEISALDAQRLAQSTASASARDIQLQTNAATAGTRARGPIASQQAGNVQPNAPAAAPPSAQAPSVQAPSVAKLPPPLPAAPVAQGDAAAAAPRERRANEPSTSQIAETVAITSSGGAGARAPARPQSERGQAAGAEREGQARSKDEAATFKAFGPVAAASVVSAFAEPGGRLQWRIADGRRLESSSDGGTTWNQRYTAGDRLRAGTAPSITSAWAVGERGLVLRLVVPGDWAEVSRPAAATLIAVSATGTQSARVTADDGRVFETADGGATWMPVSAGTGPR